jgi:hypothetical protein
VAINTEAICAALEARLTGLPGVRTLSRRLRHWNDVPPEQQPAVFLVPGPASRNGSGPYAWTLTVSAYVYVRVPKATAVHATSYSAIVDAMAARLVPANPCDVNHTLGGLVHSARLTGPVENDEGNLGEQAVAIVPIQIIAPD